MHISWLGTTTLKIQTKPQNDDITLVIDPYKSKTAPATKGVGAHIALLTQGEANTFSLSGNPFIVHTPGEIETKNVLITTTQGHQENTIIARIDSEHISLGHLGLTNKELTNEQLDVISGVDILCLPIGGQQGYDPDRGVKIVNLVEPRIVIPLSVEENEEENKKDISRFLKAIGVPEQTPEKKFTVKKKDLPQEETTIVVLSKE